MAPGHHIHNENSGVAEDVDADEHLDIHEQELQIQSERIIQIMHSMVHNMEVAACLPQLLDRQDILQEHLTEAQLQQVNTACAKYLGMPSPIHKTSAYQWMVRSTATYQKTDPKVDPKLAAALDIIINCESLKPFIESLLDKVSDAARVFLDHLRQLNKIAIDRLGITAQEEADREKKLRLAWKNNERTKAQIFEVTQKLQEQRTRLHKSLKEKEKIVKEHKATIAMINEKCDRETFRRVKESERDMMLDSKASEERQEILNEEARVAQEQYDKLVEQHLTTENDLRTKKTKIESQLISWLNKYDTDIGERQKELDEINGEYEADKAEYDKLQEMFEKQEIEYNILMAEKEEEERKEMEAKLYAFLCHRAQRRIQQAWKAYKQRKIDRKKEKALRIQKMKELKALAKLEKQQKAAEKKKEDSIDIAET